MPPIHIKLRDWLAWTPAGWSKSIQHPDESRSNAPAPPLLRRRVTNLGRMALQGAWELSDSTKARFVFASRHGEFERTLSLLESVVENREVSPADFTLSVHNALAGLLSIARRNRAGHTSIASGQQSFVCGLIEAISSLEEFPSLPVIYIYHDEPLPGVYADFNQADEETFALCLAMNKTGPGAEIAIFRERVAAAADKTNNFVGEFLRFLTGSVVETNVVGQGLGWHFRRGSAASIS